MDTRSKNISILPILLLLAVFLDLQFFPATLEDAQITFRYSLRFSEGYDFGMWNRTGSPVEGFTSVLWMVYLSLFGPNIDNIVSSSKFTGILAHIGLIGFFYLLYLRHDQGKVIDFGAFENRKAAAQAFLYTAVSLALFFPVIWYSTSGMEMLLFMALVALVLFLPLLTSNFFILSFVVILLVLVRPDGILFAFSAPTYFWFVTKNHKYGTVSAIAVLAFIALSLFRYDYFDNWMPNTYYAKSADAGILHLVSGIRYIGNFILNYVYLFIPILFAVSRLFVKRTTSHSTFLMVSLLGIAMYFIIIAKAGGDNFFAFPMWRHGLNVFPLILFCSFYSLAVLVRDKSRVISKLFVAFLSVMPILATVPSLHSSFLRAQLRNIGSPLPVFEHAYRDNRLLLWIGDITDDKTVISTSLAGALPLTVDANHIDVLGLNDAFIAHNGSFDPRGPIDSKTDMNYVLERRPDIIEGYMNASAILRNEELERTIRSARFKMNITTLLNPIFQNEYLVIKNAPYDAMNRILFIRKNYYEKIGNAHHIEVMPVSILIDIANNIMNEPTT